MPSATNPPKQTLAKHPSTPEPRPIFLPRPLGEGWGEGLPRNQPGLTQKPPKGNTSPRAHAQPPLRCPPNRPNRPPKRAKAHTRRPGHPTRGARAGECAFPQNPPNPPLTSPQPPPRPPAARSRSHCSPLSPLPFVPAPAPQEFFRKNSYAHEGPRFTAQNSPEFTSPSPPTHPFWP